MQVQGSTDLTSRAVKSLFISLQYLSALLLDSLTYVLSEFSVVHLQLLNGDF